MRSYRELGLQFVLEKIDKIERYLFLKTKSDFMKSQLLQDAVLLNLQLVSENLIRLNFDKSKVFSRAIYDYYNPNLDLTWKITKFELLELKKKVKRDFEVFR